nr:MAG TPA: hypothetical protein [Caudoviricetes sp.]
MFRCLYIKAPCILKNAREFDNPRTFCHFIH